MHAQLNNARVTGVQTRPAWRPWALVAVYFIVTSLGHLEFSLWLVRQRTLGSMTFALKDAVPWLVIAGGVGLAVWIFVQMRKNPQATGSVGLYWLVWGICVALVDRFLTYSINEYAHYPQYAFLAWLVARALDPQRKRWLPGRVLFWTTLLGMVDELQQYIWIAPSYGHYLDFNDFLVNLLAAAAGMMLYYGANQASAQTRSSRRKSWAEMGTTVVLCVATAAGWAAGLLAFVPEGAVPLPPGGWVPSQHGIGTLYLQRAPFWYQSWQPSLHRDHYLILPPWAGIFLMLAAGAVFTSFSRVRVGGRHSRQ